MRESDALGSGDVMKRIQVAMPELTPLVRQLLGCEWGQTLRTEADPGPCVEQAVKMMVIHAPPGTFPPEMTFKFCQRHHDYACELTDAHGGGVS